MLRHSFKLYIYIYWQEDKRYFTRGPRYESDHNFLLWNFFSTNAPIHDWNVFCLGTKIAARDKETKLYKKNAGQLVSIAPGKVQNVFFSEKNGKLETTRFTRKVHVHNETFFYSCIYVCMYMGMYVRKLHTMYIHYIFCVLRNISSISRNILASKLLQIITQVVPLTLKIRWFTDNIVKNKIW
jgi:hypothetical protein